MQAAKQNIKLMLDAFCMRQFDKAKAGLSFINCDQ